jgi:hypothetical protein
MIGFWDRLGISASLLCIVHCLLAPALAISIPLISTWAIPNWFHWLMAVIIFPVAFLALWRGFKRHHQGIVLVLGTVGLFLIGVGLFIHGDNLEFAFTGLGGLFLVSAHLINLRACHTCD